MNTQSQIQALEQRVENNKMERYPRPYSAGVLKLRGNTKHYTIATQMSELLLEKAKIIKIL